MGRTVQANKTFNFGAVSIFNSAVIEGEGVLDRVVDIPAAKEGSLTTRTSDTVGTLTMNAGHGITTGARLDIYWTTAAGVKGHRRGVTVGTVAGNEVPFSLGAGDNLPVDETDVIAMVPVENAFEVTGDEIMAIAAGGNARCIIVFAESDETEHYAIIIEPDTGGGDGWADGSGTNPIASDSVDKVYMSHAHVSLERTIKAAALLD